MHRKGLKKMQHKKTALILLSILVLSLGVGCSEKSTPTQTSETDKTSQTTETASTIETEKPEKNEKETTAKTTSQPDNPEITSPKTPETTQTIIVTSATTTPKTTSKTTPTQSPQTQKPTQTQPPQTQPKPTQPPATNPPATQPPATKPPALTPATKTINGYVWEQVLSTDGSNGFAPTVVWYWKDDPTVTSTPALFAASRTLAVEPYRSNPIVGNFYVTGANSTAVECGLTYFDSVRHVDLWNGSGEIMIMMFTE
jgi:hypothetical protein